jgi:transcriptional regulator with XRE-family HTH domain
MKTKKAKEKIFGNRIRVILREIKMSQVELSDITELESSYLSKIILGKRMCISLPIAFKIAKALNRSVEEVFIAKRPVKPINNEEGD